MYCTQSNDKYLIVELSLDNFQKLLFFYRFTNIHNPLIVIELMNLYWYFKQNLVNMTILQFVQRSLNLKLTFLVDHTPPISIIIQHTTLQDWPVPLPYNSLSCHWSMFYLHFEGSRILFTKFVYTECHFMKNNVKIPSSVDGQTWTWFYVTSWIFDQWTHHL